MSEWISTKDRVPDDWIPVLARVAWQTRTIIAVRSRNTADWFEQSEYEEIKGDAIVCHSMEDFTITHWMELPEPPEDI